jgi:formylglycine-generating enzyme
VKRVMRGLMAGVVVAVVGCSVYSVSLLGSPGADASLPEVSLPDAGPDSTPPPAVSCLDGGLGAGDQCGPPGAQTTNCCTTLPVPGGLFVRNNRDGGQAELHGFSLDKYEVTVGRFRKFVSAGKGTQTSAPAAGAGTNPNLPLSGWDLAWSSLLPLNSAELATQLTCNVDGSGPDPNATWTTEPLNNEVLPINCVSWYEAFAFCIWDGGRLPTDVEWDYAAEGGGAGRYYPWSTPATATTIGTTYANYLCDSTGNPIFFDAGADANAIGDNIECTLADITRPGHYSPKGDGLWGHADLAGNMWEWVLDWDYEIFTRPCSDCATLSPMGVGDAALLERVQRGGGYDSPASLLITAAVYPEPPALLLDDDGFRCARDP